jgi:DNA polymerase-3 subunit epsilon
MAHAKFPGSPASLDALCKRFDISLSSRDKHGAIIDSELLAAVYLELSGGRAMSLGLDARAEAMSSPSEFPVARQREQPLIRLIQEAEAKAHTDFVAKLKSEIIWEKVWARQQRGVPK